MLWSSGPEDKVTCHLCAHRCVIADGEMGICNVREHRSGKLHTLVYGRTIARHVDPIEKKPLMHFYPGSKALSMATAGCNFRCRWCQNSEISQMPRERHLIMGEKATPEELVEQAILSGSRSIAYTYTEPTMFFEYAYDTARKAKEKGLANVFVTNGYMTAEMLGLMAPYLEAANVDLKSFRDETYRKFAGARLQPVLDSIRRIKEKSIWLEVTTLVIPGLNDSPQELEDIARFLAELDPDIPWHISRFHPDYLMEGTPPTPVGVLEQARNIGRNAGLRYLYGGNIGGEVNTFCHSCGETVIIRSGSGVTSNRITQTGACPSCKTPVAGVGMTGI
ncbi:AmmeMemoRadiSam system radical SAM enzyme [bacterium]|nr:AmmeMemoRadiSam system radical SAM enzyme [bacterium]